MTEKLDHLTLEAVQAIHAEVLAAHGGTEGLRAKTLLESAIGTPQATRMGQPVLKDGIEMAAAYLCYICCNHPFEDGNKRTASAACLVFLSENGLLPDEKLDTDGWEKLILDMATGRIDREDTTKRLRKLLRKA